MLCNLAGDLERNYVDYPTRGRWLYLQLKPKLDRLNQAIEAAVKSKGVLPAPELYSATLQSLRSSGWDGLFHEPCILRCGRWPSFDDRADLRCGRLCQHLQLTPDAVT